VLVALALLAAYLIGSVNFAVFIAKLHGVDIREEGSGNPGMSNVLRTVGKAPAAAVLVGDTLKGVLGAYLGHMAAAPGAAAPGAAAPAVELSHWVFAAGLAAVVGHCFPVFHRFRGGRGVATGLGMLLFTVPLTALIVVAVWALTAKLTKTASIASLLAVSATLPLAVWLEDVSGAALVWLAAAIVIVVGRHKDNIARMIRGQESKVPT